VTLLLCGNQTFQLCFYICDSHKEDYGTYLDCRPLARRLRSRPIRARFRALQ